MAYRGQTIDNPVTGERLTFIQTAEDTAGESLVFDDTMRAHARPAAAHRHTRQRERLDMIRGSLAYRIGGTEDTLESGQQLVVPACTPHRWWNPTDEEIVVQIEFRPALKIENLLGSLCDQARAGTPGPGALPSFRQMVAITRHHETFLAGPPIWAQRALRALLGLFTPAV